MGRGNKPQSSRSTDPLTELSRTIDDGFKELHQEVIEANEKKAKLDETLRSIDELYEKMRAEKRTSNYHRSKLKTLYTNALKDSETQADVLRRCLAEISSLRRLRSEKHGLTRKAAGGDGAAARGSQKPMRRGALMVLLQQNANTLPLFVGKLGEAPPALCGAIPEATGHVFATGDAVAALVKADDGEENWILAEVVASQAANNRYEVEDVDEEQKERHQLPRSKLIALASMRANPQTEAEALFAQEAFVLALYPQTTCFYKGVVEQVPIAPTDDYLIAFEDSSYPSGYSPPLPVPQRYVVAYAGPRVK